jgi:hypothetical protein
MIVSLSERSFSKVKIMLTKHKQRLFAIVGFVYSLSGRSGCSPANRLRKTLMWNSAHIPAMLFGMAMKKTRKRLRRRPTQRRAVETVEAVLDATVRLLKRGGTNGITTNRIAEVAGVSIGSLYQYFSQ